MERSSKKTNKQKTPLLSLLSCLEETGFLGLNCELAAVMGFNETGVFFQYSGKTSIFHTMQCL